MKLIIEQNGAGRSGSLVECNDTHKTTSFSFGFIIGFIIADFCSFVNCERGKALLFGILCAILLSENVRKGDRE